LFVRFDVILSDVKELFLEFFGSTTFIEIELAKEPDQKEYGTM